jgi:hypothetical protein
LWKIPKGSMFAWLKRKRAAVLAEADEFLESFGNLAYAEADMRRGRRCVLVTSE